MILALACSGWVLLSAGVALLPLRRQFVPGVLLLLAAPVLIVWIALEVGVLAAGLALAAVASMYRNPLRYLVTKWRGGATGAGG